jgi:hypothetical protein
MILTSTPRVRHLPKSINFLVNRSLGLWVWRSAKDGQLADQWHLGTCFGSINSDPLRLFRRPPFRSGCIADPW